METLLMNNIFFVYLLGILVIINYEALGKKQKIAVIYVCSFGMTFNSNLNSITVSILLLFILFIYEEYLCTDLVKIKYVTTIKYKLLDFVYMYMVNYKVFYILVAIILKSSICWTVITRVFSQKSVMDVSLKNIISIISIIILLIGIHKMFSNPIEQKNFKQINQKFNEYPYYSLPLRDEEKRAKLFEKLEMIADIEDYTFFLRKNSYSSFSIEFIKVVANKKRNQKENMVYTKTSLIYKVWKRVKLFFRVETFSVFLQSKRKLRVIEKFIKKLYKWSYKKLIHKVEYLKRKIKRYLRGYSTIEMQLIRILAYEKGLKMGIPRNLEELYLIFTRKVYEIIYSPMFFGGLKRYLMIPNTKDYYRYYLVYIYLHTVQTNLNGKVFSPLDKVFGNVDVIDWPKEALFIIGLGLSNSKITLKRIYAHMNIIHKYNLDLDRIYQLVDCI